MESKANMGLEVLRTAVYRFCRPVHYHFATAPVVAILLLASPPVYAEATPNFSKLVDAIYQAEGGRKASRPYGVFYKGCDWNNPSYCRQICLNTVRNTYKRWFSSKSSLSYLEFLRDRYAPLSHHSLNQHWLKNVEFFYAQGV